jgi:hypothetical protein
MLVHTRPDEQPACVSRIFPCHDFETKYILKPSRLKQTYLKPSQNFPITINSMSLENKAKTPSSSPVKAAAKASMLSDKEKKKNEKIKDFIQLIFILRKK